MKSSKRTLIDDIIPADGKMPEHAPIAPQFSVGILHTDDLASGAMDAARRASCHYVLDLTRFRTETEQLAAENHWRDLSTSIPQRSLKVNTDQLHTWPGLSSLLQTAATIFLSGWEEHDAATWMGLLPSICSVYLEVSRMEQIRQALTLPLGVAGWLACGTETVGTTKNSASQFLLLQALSRQPLPFLLADPAGEEALAACSIAGAAGALCSDRLLAPGEFATPAAASRTMVRALHRLQTGAVEIVEIAAGGLFERYSPLAKDHGTEFPIVQGPMTRVSDSAPFAQAVAEGGALPMLALALQRGSDCERLLEDTIARVGGRNWGVGLLGFAPRAILEEQLACVRRFQPPFCVLSGGRPDQVAMLEAQGTRTYLHVPVPKFVKPYFDRGVRRFVFEGSECGGHTGPNTSFALWGQSVEALLALSNEELSSVSVLFAGGIHDALSSAMTSAFAARLASRGARVGVLMGTAYLFTQEIVATGAVVPAFQTEALRSNGTALLQTGPGHIIRCAQTSFIDEFAQQRSTLQSEGHPSEEINRRLEAITLGRARAASRGMWRHDDGTIVPLEETEQQRLGMYMMGEVASLRDAVIPMADLHAEVSDDASALIQSATGCSCSDGPPAGEPIAIIGMSALVPGASDLESFWKLLTEGGNPIREIPQTRFDWRLFFDEDQKARDKIYSRWGGFLDEVPFDPLLFGIPPRSLHSISTAQLLGLEVARRALIDAGYPGAPGAMQFDRENTSLCIGVSSGGDLQNLYITRGTLPVSNGVLTEDAADRLPEWTEESFPGTLLNVISGRISNRLDLGGSNRVVDAACASSLAAIQIAVMDLQAGRSNMAIAGGIDFDQSIHCYLGFSKTKALSPRGVARPFDKHADGIVLSEGVALFVLKRLSDAEREGDRIYATIRSLEGSSDGKGRSLTSPRPLGQRRAFERAYRAARISPATIGLYEAHGTGTVVGDRAELETVTKFLQGAGSAPGSCGIGSVKELLGHTKSAAGAVSMMKVVLSLHHRVLPPMHALSAPLESLEDPTSPVTAYNAPTPWLQGETPRRAGVSAFGFGGTNFHAVLQEYVAGEGAHGSDPWPCELFVFSAEDHTGLREQLRKIESELAAQPALPLRVLAHSCARRASSGGVRLALVAAGRDELARALTKAITALERGEIQLRDPGIAMDDSAQAGKVVFLFPGQGSQYVGMGREATLYLADLREAFEFGNRETAGLFDTPLARLCMPPLASNKQAAESQSARLTATDAAQASIGVVSSGLLHLLRRLGVTPDATAGHSYGELMALHAAGVLSQEELMRLTLVRGRVMREAGSGSPGSMVAVRHSADEVARIVSLNGHLTIANFNAPKQCVLSGTHAALDEAMAALRQHNIGHKPLPVAAAFHSPAMDSASLPLAECIDSLELQPPGIPVYGNLDGSPYSIEPAEIAHRLRAHLSSSVHFEQQIRAMYRDGVRTFIEVGPRQVLTGLTGSILEGQPHRAIAMDGTRGGLRALLEALAQIHAVGIAWQPLQLFAGRNVTVPQPIATEPGDWFVDGGNVRHRSETAPVFGVKPLVTMETAAEIATLHQYTSPGAVSDISAGASDLLQAYGDYQQTMRGIVESQERVLTALIEGASGVSTKVSVATRIVPPAVEVVPPRSLPPEVIPPAVPPREAIASHKDLTQLVVAVLSDRTGYPPEMLKLDHDVEADIGVDSIKRIDILLEIERRLTPAEAEALQSHMSALNDFRTIRQLAGLLEQALHQPAQAPVEVVAQLPAQPPAESENTCPSFVMQSHEKPLSRNHDRLPVGLHLITEDECGIAPLVLDALRARGAEAHLIPVATLASASELRASLQQLVHRHGIPVSILHLGSFSDPVVVTGEAWHRQTEVQIKSLFEILQLCTSELDREPSARCTVVAATGLGGLWGREHTAGVLSPGAGVHGLLRTAQAEQPRFAAAAIDFDPRRSPAAIAQSLIDELLQRAPDAEVGYREGTRFVFHPVETTEDVHATNKGWWPEEGSVVLLTAGARGITARIAAEFAAPGVRLILLGRGTLDEAVQDTGTDETALRVFRDSLIVEMQRTGQMWKPAQIEDRIRDEKHRRERAAAVANLRALGADVHYESVDVSDPGQLRACIRSLYRRFGRIDAVVHGAGIIEDALLSRKSSESFDAVFHTKTQSLPVFEQELQPDSLRCLLLFSSVSGRFGNPGQCDYAAANEVLSRWAWQAAERWPNARVLSVCWGPWAEIGMASGSVERTLRARGILPILPRDACDFLRRQLTEGSNSEIIAGEGFWRSLEVEPVEVMAAD